MTSAHDSDRRTFLKTLGLASAAALVGGAPAHAEAPRTGDLQVPRRQFGRHDFQVSSLAIGGHTLRLAADAEAQRIIDHAEDFGIDFLDNAWDYHGGKAEELMGRCIRGKRDRFFLMSKCCMHGQGGKMEAMKYLEDSLRRLGTDRLDLYQLHALTSLKEVEHAFAPGGPMEALAEAKKQGKIRFTGFTGHSDPQVHLAMLDRGFQFDACLMVVSATSGLKAGGDWEKKVLPECVRQGIAPLGMKTMGGSQSDAVRQGKLTAEEALSFALTQPVTTVITGVKSVEELTQNARIAQTFQPMSEVAGALLKGRFTDDADIASYAAYCLPGYRDGHGVGA